jgi:predicted esterase
MKILQDSKEDICLLNCAYPIKFFERKPKNPRKLVLLLHGLNERGLRIYRKLIKFLPLDSYVLAPNAPYPIARSKPDRIDFGFSWYFYDRVNSSYPIDQSWSISILSELIRIKNPDKLPVIIIGFSQGGYLAPILACAMENQVEQIIGIGCEFRDHLLSKLPNFSLTSIHGADDMTITPSMGQEQIELLKKRGIFVNSYVLPDTKHEINSSVALTIKNILESSWKK